MVVWSPQAFIHGIWCAFVHAGFIAYFVFNLFFYKGFHRQVVSKENSPTTKIQIKLQYTKFFGKMQKKGCLGFETAS